jgi:hypothetical protein
MTNFSKASLADKRVSVLSASVPLSTFSINILRQVRTSMSLESVHGLAEEILAVGQLTPARLLALEPREAKNYITEINRLWGVKQRLSRMKLCQIDGVDYYVFVVFGHRRLAACRLATKLIKNGAKSTNFDGHYRCEIVFGLSMLEAVFMQMGENNYVPPTQRDQLTAMWALWRYMRRENPRLSVRAFAKRAGQREKKVLEMLRFTSLPESIQSWIEPGEGRVAVSYPLLLQVARLVLAMRVHNLEITNKEIEEMVVSLVARRVKLKDFKAEVSHRIELMRGGQSGLFGSSVEVYTKPKAIAAAEVVNAQYHHLAYLKLIQQLAERGLFGGENPLLEKDDVVTTYSTNSPAKLTGLLGEVVLQAGHDLANRLRNEGKPNRKLENVLKALPATTALISGYAESE